MSLRALSTSVACSCTEHCGCHHAAIVQSLPRITIKVGVHITDSTLCRTPLTTVLNQQFNECFVLGLKL